MSNQLKMAQIDRAVAGDGWSHRRIARELDIHRDTVALRAAPPDPDPKPAISTAGSAGDAERRFKSDSPGDRAVVRLKTAISTAGVAESQCECDPHRE
ncbi:MAG: hypothetical protein IPH13_21705 [Planctomycetes bacterium]|nr:hypothetical protein [Planctomycetota bacterium]